MLKQGKRRDIDSIIDFHTLAAYCKWNKEALQDVFWQALSDYIKNRLATHDPPHSLKELEDLAIRIDRRGFK